jgi:hypothetical protein
LASICLTTDEPCSILMKEVAVTQKSRGSSLSIETN